MRPRQPGELDAATWAAIAGAAAAPWPAVAPEAEAGPIDWKAELLAEVGDLSPPAPAPAPPPPIDTPPSQPDWIPPALHPGAIAARPSPLAFGERKLLPPAPRQDEPPPRIPGYEAGRRPRDLETYVKVLEWAMWSPSAGFLDALRREPLFPYAKRRWRPAEKGTAWWADDASRRSNLEIAHVLYDRISALMATYFDFEPAPMAYLPTMGGKALGLWSPRLGAIAVSDRLLGGPLHEVVNTIAHEQTHAMQAEWVGRPATLPDPWVRSLVAYWAWEWRNLARIPYERRGIEIHAFMVGDWAGEVIRSEL